jgi:hypothetical protein
VLPNVIDDGLDWNLTKCNAWLNEFESGALGKTLSITVPFGSEQTIAKAACQAAGLQVRVASSFHTGKYGAEPAGVGAIVVKLRP